MSLLTPREREVLALIAQGLSIAEISERLHRSQKTIQSHRLSLGRKLNATNRVALARIALQIGLSPLSVSSPKSASDNLVKALAQRTAGIGIACRNSDTIRVADVRLARMHGYTVEELEGMPIAILYPPTLRSHVQENGRLIHDMGFHSFQSTHLRKDGTTFPVLVEGIAIKTHTGEDLYRIVSVWDLSAVDRNGTSDRPSTYRRAPAADGNPRG